MIFVKNGYNSKDFFIEELDKKQVLEKFGIPIYEYTPMEVKQILTGYGRADKKEVEQMVKIALRTDKLPKLDDTVDSIAIAISYTRSIDAISSL